MIYSNAYQGTSPFMYDLVFSVFSGNVPISVEIEVADELDARRAAAGVIAERLGKPGVFVHLSDNGTFRAGAGFWSQFGSYSLTLLASSTGLSR